MFSRSVLFPNGNNDIYSDKQLKAHFFLPLQPI